MSRMQELRKKFRETWFWRHGAFFLALFIAMGVVAVYVWKLHQFPFSKDPEAWGQLGDYFGGVLNPIVAGLALFLLAVSVDIQRRELHETKVALKSQAESTARQTFEGTFFQLLARFESVRQSISEPDPHAGKKALGEMVGWIGREFSKGRHGGGFQGALGSYKAAYARFESSLGPYFRTLYHVFKLVHESYLSDAEQFRYAYIARAALSTDELFLLFHSGLTEEGAEFKPLIEKFGLLKHINEAKLMAGLRADDYYGRDAFL